MKYYAANNQYGTELSVGFENTWDVYVFESKEVRDQFVENGNLSTRAIRRDEVTKYATNYNITSNETNAPKPFSGEYWGIDENTFMSQEEGLIGQVVCCDAFDTAERFYK